MAKRKIFISYHHKNEQAVIDEFIKKFSEDYEVFTDGSLEDASDSDNSEYLNQVCREAIDGTSVTMVLIGKQTGCRKFVDWEIRYTLHLKHGLVAISRSGLADSEACLPERFKDNRKSGFAKWYVYPTDAAGLMAIIDEAYNADTSKIDNSREKMGRNSIC
ncbi:MAG: TIR domain-containing protein [Elusimicrobiota bacterium]